ncbi:MAG: hypothetical protein IT536_13170 [Hyphomicrobiales bacterium]|nr:hypothetical protein [Hyphomicrobiales bacterium]
MKPEKPLATGSGDGPQPVRAAARRSGAPDAAAQQPQTPGSIEPMPLRPRPMMQNDLQPGKSRGRLGRDVQAKLGKTLQAYFDDVVKEGVPERFRLLLQEYDDRSETDRADDRKDDERQDKGLS